MKYVMIDRQNDIFDNTFVVSLPLKKLQLSLNNLAYPHRVLQIFIALCSILAQTIYWHKTYMSSYSQNLPLLSSTFWS